MSIPVRTVVTALFSTDATLISLLAPNPNDGTKPAVFYGAANDQQPVYPCLTYRTPTSTPDARFRPPAAGGGGRSAISLDVIEAEVWTNQRATNADTEAIADRVQTLLDGEAISISGGRIFRAECQVREGPLWDPTLKVWFILLRFRLRVSTS